MLAQQRVNALTVSYRQTTSLAVHSTGAFQNLTYCVTKQSILTKQSTDRCSNSSNRKEEKKQSKAKQRQNSNVHGDTAVLDLLHPETFHVLPCDATGTFGEAQGVVSVITGDFPSFGPLAVVCDTFEPTGDEEDLEPALGGDHTDRVERCGVGDVRERRSCRTGQQPGVATVGVESVRSTWAQVQWEVDAELLHHPTDRGDHSDSTVLDFSILEPLDSIRAGILQDCTSKSRDFVPRLDGHTEGIVDSCVQSNR
mmetsp:Transcript_159/g.315  ORF Transcript_159/g.315 Transcript_159/m.315 type:complete len:254 (+) Transcript_159:647-1408(+)